MLRHQCHCKRIVLHFPLIGLFYMHFLQLLIYGGGGTLTQSRCRYPVTINRWQQVEASNRIKVRVATCTLRLGSVPIASRCAVQCRYSLYNVAYLTRGVIRAGPGRLSVARGRATFYSSPVPTSYNYYVHRSTAHVRTALFVLLQSDHFKRTTILGPHKRYVWQYTISMGGRTSCCFNVWPKFKNIKSNL